MIAADALSHVAHNSTVESRRKHLDVLIIGAPFFCLWCSMALWAGSRLFGQGECWRIHFKQNFVVTSRADGLQTELAALHFAEQFLAARAPHFFAIGFAHRLSLTEPRFRPTSPLPTQPPTMRNGARSRIWRLRRKPPTEILKGQPTPRFTIVTAWGEASPFSRARCSRSRIICA